MIKIGGGNCKLFFAVRVTSVNGQILFQAMSIIMHMFPYTIVYCHCHLLH